MNKFGKINMRRGFTVVELLTVIVILAILAGIVIVSFSNWRKQTAIAEVSSDLNNVAAAMESSRNFGSGYPATIPSSFTASKNVTVVLKSSSSTAYCVEATSTAVTSVVYHVSGPNRNPVVGIC